MELDWKALQKACENLPGPNTPEKLKMVIDLFAKGDAPDKPADAPKVDASKKLPLTADAPAVALAEKPAEAAPCADIPPAIAPMADPMPPSAEEDVDSRLMAATGLDEDGLGAAIDAHFDEVVAVLMGAGGDATALSKEARDAIVAGKDAQIVALTKERNTLQTAANARLASDSANEVDSLIKRTPALAPQRDSLLALARSKPSEFRSVAAALAPVGANLVQPQAVALARAGETPTDVIASKDPSSVPDTHPLVRETRASLALTRLPQATQDKALLDLKTRIAAGAN